MMIRLDSLTACLFILVVILGSIFLGSVIGSTLALRFAKTAPGGERVRWHHYLVWPALYLGAYFAAFLLLLFLMHTQTDPTESATTRSMRDAPPKARPTPRSRKSHLPRSRPA